MTEEQHRQDGDAAGPFASSWRRRHLTVEERIARGRTARTEAPRLGHGRWEPAADRPDPIALLEEQAVTRVPELVPIRYGRMLVSPFTFYRGAALIMAADLAGTPVTGVTVQLCGDAHLSNFGLFGTPERQMLFDINDFDETLPGPWEWDVKRLAASFEIMGRDRGFSPADRRAVVMAGVREYRNRMRRSAGMGSLDAWYEHFEAGMLLKLVRQEVRVKRVGQLDRALGRCPLPARPDHHRGPRPGPEVGQPAGVAPADQADHLGAGDRMRQHARVHHRRLDRPVRPQRRHHDQAVIAVHQPGKVLESAHCCSLTLPADV